MINIALAQWIASLILLIIAYFVSVAINSAVQIWVADALGDTNAKHSGFMSFNHYDIIRLILLLISHVGLSRTLPINAHYIVGKHKLARLFIMHMTETITSIILGTLALAGTFCLTGPSIAINLISRLRINSISAFSAGVIPLKHATDLLPHMSSLAIITVLFLVTIVFLNAFIAALSFIVNSFKYAMIVGFERGYRYIEYADLIILFGSFFAIFILGDRLELALLKHMAYAAYTISSIFYGAL